MKISYGTDVGITRKENQDSVYIHKFSDLSGLFVVADGMGGYEGGKLASSLAVQKISEHVKNEFDASFGSEQIKELLQVSIKEASARVYEVSQEKAELKGMGTTVVACIIHEGTLYTASVGDSRGYLFTNKVLRQITTDHSLVHDLYAKGLISKEEAIRHPQRNVITRAVGSEPIVLIDTFETKLKGGDTVLICSDGLHTMVSEEKISEILENPAENTAERLIDIANENGGKDNITVITVKIPEEVK